MGRGVKSQVSCTSSRFQTPPAPSIPSLSPSLTAAFHSSTVLNQRFFSRDGIQNRPDGLSEGRHGRIGTSKLGRSQRDLNIDSLDQIYTL